MKVKTYFQTVSVAVVNIKQIEMSTKLTRYHH